MRVTMSLATNISDFALVKFADLLPSHIGAEFAVYGFGGNERVKGKPYS